MDDSPESAPEVPPYTGRTGAVPEPVLPPAGVLAASPDPVIRWGRMGMVQILSGILVAFLFPLLVFVTSSSPNDMPGLLVVVLVASFLIGSIAGGLPFLLARVTHAIVTIGGRGATREVLAVAGGAFLGSALLAIAGVLLTAAPSALVILLVIGVPSAIGFSIWVLVAWWPRLQSRPVR